MMPTTQLHQHVGYGESQQSCAAWLLMGYLLGYHYGNGNLLGFSEDYREPSSQRHVSEGLTLF